MTNITRPTTVRVLHSLLLVFVILWAQYIVLTHEHDSPHSHADKLCKICVSGEHLGHALAHSAQAGINPIKEFFLAGLIVHAYPVLFFTHALARAPPTGF